MRDLLLKLLTRLGERAETERIEQLLLQIQFLKEEARVLRGKLPKGSG